MQIFRFKAYWVTGNQKRFTENNRDAMGENENQLRFDKIDVDMFTWFTFDQK